VCFFEKRINLQNVLHKHSSSLKLAFKSIILSNHTNNGITECQHVHLHVEIMLKLNQENARLSVVGALLFKSSI